MPTSRGIRPPTIFLACKLREKSSIIELVLRLSEYNNHLNRVGVNLPDEIALLGKRLAAARVLDVSVARGQALLIRRYS